MVWTPPTLADALCIQCEIGAGEEAIDNMVIVNAASVDWTGGRLDTGTYLDIVEATLEIDPLDFLGETLQLYLPKADSI